ncbi:MAG: cytochrome c maturation protein CcmE [Bacteroidota bacterium]|nr:cytochrome c maturation protein CcmE [Bacteroidota bacterium]
MKNRHIIALIILVIGLGIIFSMVFNSSSYSTFKKAITDNQKEIHIIGKIDHSKPVEFIYPIFTFYLIDSEGTEMKVISKDGKPPDFDSVDKIGIIGKVDKELFIAKKILLKCPSKYKE